ncbi:MAG TPA: 16S rRNA (uracil(1498)-N(3))-methyltransferase [Rhodanobacteraceae bacterium]|nr:16S rRNA (uracil(1498)-N(3))-methyltransferase [Rhodanobacteraceae bacterium]
MRSIRLFADTPLEPGVAVALPAKAAAHALRVLRLKSGDAVVLFNGDGHEYPARLVSAGARELRAEVTLRESPVRESPLQVTLIQALARGEKMDWIVQKATELGIARIVPATTERSEVKLDAARGEKRLEHWRAIAIAACEQCGRNVLPVIEPPVELSTWLKTTDAMEAGSRWMLHPGSATRVRDLSTMPPAALALAVGPEGGFGESDVAAMRAHDFRELALGPRILRTETAGVVAIAALQAILGDL